MTPTRLFLIGPMGAGKTTAGRLLAQELGMDFFDTDKIVEERSGADIPWIFDVEGEEGFRRRETEALRQISEAQNCVIATGGGIVAVEENRRIIRKSGYVVYLHASIEQQLSRTAKDKSRPLLQVDEPRVVIERLKEERGPFYEQLADHTIFTDKYPTKRAVKEILAKLNED